MAIPKKPTAKLAIDGIIGQKTRDAAAYLVGANKFTTGTQIADLDKRVNSQGKRILSPFVQKLQFWLNRHPYWRNVKLDIVDGTWNNLLVGDGIFGAYTSNKLGGMMIYLSDSPWTGGPGCLTSERTVGWAGANIKMFQGLLNAGIWPPHKPSTPGVNCVNAHTVIRTTNDTWRYSVI